MPWRAFEPDISESIVNSSPGQPTTSVGKELLILSEGGRGPFWERHMLGCRLVRISHERSDDRRCTGFVCREKSGLDQVGFEREYGGQLRVRQLSRVATVSRIEISPPAVILPRKTSLRPLPTSAGVPPPEAAGRGHANVHSLHLRGVEHYRVAAQAPSARLPLIATAMLSETPYLVPILVRKRFRPKDLAGHSKVLPLGQ